MGRQALRDAANGSPAATQDFYRDRWKESDFGASAIQENLEFVRDRKWVVNECLRRLCSTSEAMAALLAYGLAETEKFRDHAGGIGGDHEKDFFLLRRLRLLQFKDRLDTYLGIHMGRFSSQTYMIFRSTSLHKLASTFAEHGKTSAVELLIKRHAYTLAPHVLGILDGIPETLSPHTYEQLLPRLSPPQVLLPRRGQDWAESTAVLRLTDSGVSSEVDLHECTEFMVNLSRGLRWPAADEITSWYLQRARRIDQLSGQLENSLFLLDAGIQKGVSGLNDLWKDVAVLCRVSFSNAEDEASLTLAAWEALDAFEKFKMMLRGVTEDNVVDRLVEVTVPFVQTLPGEKQQSFLLRYLKEVASTNLQLCAVILEDSCRPPYKGVLFKDDAEIIAAGLDCIYSSSQTDEWDLMASILSKLPWEDDKQQKASDAASERGLRRGFVNALRYPNRTLTDTSMDAPFNVKNPAISTELERRLRIAEGHIQAGKILFQYQLPTKIGFLASSNEDVKGTKQMLRLLLSKFLRKVPGRSDGEWIALWRDLQFLQEKAFTFLEKDYLLSEFCRGLLKAGRFHLAKSYFKDPGAALLSVEKIESLVLQTSRELFYSANNLDSPDIDSAKECLSLIPYSASGIAERDIIVAVTERLPYLGVTMLPAQFRQIKDPMEVLKMAIESHKESHVPLEEVFDVARLLGFKDTSQMAYVEEALAREAAAHGDVEVAQELCLSLARKDHGKVWDLCAAIGRGPDAERLDIKSRKELISFSLRHCDDESIGELLAAWKEFDSVDEYLPVTLLEVSDSASTEGSEEEEVGARDEFLQSDVPIPKDDEPLTEVDDTPTDVSSLEPTESKLAVATRRSRDIVTQEFPDGEVREADLATVEDACHCFSRLAENTSTKKQAVALKLLLELWETVFETEENNEEGQERAEDKGGEDGWGDGWQDFEVAETAEAPKLQSLWKIACHKLIQCRGLEGAMSVLDRWSASSSPLLTEDEAKDLVGYAAQENPLWGMKLALLLPYESLWSIYVDRAEAELQRQGVVLDKAAVVLLLSARLLPTIASASNLTALFSALSKVFGELLRKSQAGLLLPEDSLGAPSLDVIVPYFISEMTRGRHYGAAASLVLQLMRVPQSFATWNISHFALKRYLEAQQQQQRQKRESFDPERLRESSLFYLCETISRMVGSFAVVVTEALRTLGKDMK